MQHRTKLIAAAAVAVLAVGGTAAIATQQSEDDQPITGEALQRASDAALEHLGEGEVSDTEVGDEESLYEVEVTLDDGTEVDVQLDEDFTVVGEEADGAADDTDDTDDTEDDTDTAE